MPTRADFYVGVGKQAEWLGSIAFDGYPDGIPEAVLLAPTAQTFRAGVQKFLGARHDATLPDQGWPWPWEDSRTTDFAYCFGSDHVLVFAFGYGPADARNQWTSHVYDSEQFRSGPKAEFPDMTERQNVVLGQRSGTITLTSQ